MWSIGGKRREGKKKEKRRVKKGRGDRRGLAVKIISKQTVGISSSYYNDTQHIYYGKGIIMLF